jgi:hypothetical protein
MAIIVSSTSLSLAPGFSLMRFGNSSVVARESVPEGRPKIAQRFNAGWKREDEMSPDGTVEIPMGRTGPLSSLRDSVALPDRSPALKSWAIFTYPSGTSRVSYSYSVIA